MAEGNLQLPPNSTGSFLRTEVVDVGVGPVHQEVITRAAADGTLIDNGTVPFFTAALSAKTAVKAAAGRLYGYHLFNPGTSLAYVQCFNKLVGAVTVGTTAPDWVWALPSNANAQIGVDGMFEIPVKFDTGLTIAATTTPTGGSAPGTALVVSLFFV